MTAVRAAGDLFDASLDELLAEAATIRDRHHGTRVTYSPKVFVPLTHLCRDRCGYCTFAQPPARVVAPYLSPDEVLDIARAGTALGCKEALFTLGDQQHPLPVGIRSTVTPWSAKSRVPPDRVR